MNHRYRRCVTALGLVLILALASLMAHIWFSQRGYVAPTAATASVPKKPEGTELPIVMYHHILKEQSRLNKYTISPDEFRGDMQYLKDNGYTPITMAQLIDYVDEGAPLPIRPAIITFDDGYESFYEYAYPILKEFGFPAVFSVVGRYADEFSQTEDHRIRYSHSNWSQLAEMQTSGLVEVQNHSYNLHTNDKGRHGAKKNDGESVAHYRTVLLGDVGKMQRVCEERLGIWPNTFTYPFGQISAETLPILKELGFRAVLTCREKLNYITGDPAQLYHLYRFNRPHGTSLESLLRQARAGGTAE